jgi:hypothetical protein
LDVDAPEVALLSVRLELRGRTLRGDRIDIHDRAFPQEPRVTASSWRGLRSSLPLAESSCSRVLERTVHGKGWIQTRGLGEPDRIVRVRGTHGPSLQ